MKRLVDRTEAATDSKAGKDKANQGGAAAIAAFENEVLLMDAQIQSSFEQLKHAVVTSSDEEQMMEDLEKQEDEIETDLKRIEMAKKRSASSKKRLSTKTPEQSPPSSSSSSEVSDDEKSKKDNKPSKKTDDIMKYVNKDLEKDEVVSKAKTVTSWRDSVSKGKFERLQERNNKVVSEYESLQKEHQKALDSLQQTVENNRVLGLEKEKFKTELANLKDEHEELQDEHDELRDEKQATEGGAKKRSSITKSVYKRLEDKHGRVLSEYEELYKDHQKCLEELRHLTHEKRNLALKHTEVRDHLADLAEENQYLMEDHREVVRRASVAHIALPPNLAILRTQSRQIDSDDEELTAEKRRSMVSAAKHSRLAQKYQKSTNDYEKLYMEHQHALEQIQKWQNDYHVMFDKSQKLTDELTELHDEHAELHQENREATAVNMRLRRENAQSLSKEAPHSLLDDPSDESSGGETQKVSAKKHFRLFHRHEDTKKEVDRLRDELAKMSDKFRKAMDENKKMSDEYKITLEEFDDLKDAHEHLQDAHQTILTDRESDVRTAGSRDEDVKTLRDLTVGGEATVSAKKFERMETRHQKAVEDFDDLKEKHGKMEIAHRKVVAERDDLHAELQDLHDDHDELQRNHEDFKRKARATVAEQNVGTAVTDRKMTEKEARRIVRKADKDKGVDKAAKEEEKRKKKEEKAAAKKKAEEDKAALLGTDSPGSAAASDIEGRQSSKDSSASAASSGSEHLDDLRDQLSSQYKALKIENTELEENYQKANRDLEKLKVKLKSQSEMFDSTAEDNRKKMKSLLTLYDKLEMEKEYLEESNAELQEKLDKIEGKHSQAANDLSKLQVKHQKILDKNADLKKLDEFADLQNAHNELKDKHDELQEKLEQHQSKAQKDAGEHKKLKSRHEKLIEKQQSLDPSASSHVDLKAADDLEELKDKHDLLQTKFDALSKENDKSTKNFERLQTRHELLKAEGGNLDVVDEFERLKDEYEDLRAENDATTRTIERTEASLQKLQARHQKLIDQSKDFQDADKAAQLQEDYDELVKRFEELDNYAAGLEADLEKHAPGALDDKIADMENGNNNKPVEQISVSKNTILPDSPGNYSPGGTNQHNIHHAHPTSPGGHSSSTILGTDFGGFGNNSLPPTRPGSATDDFGGAFGPTIAVPREHANLLQLVTRLEIECSDLRKANANLQNQKDKLEIQLERENQRFDKLLSKASFPGASAVVSPLTAPASPAAPVAAAAKRITAARRISILEVSSDEETDPASPATAPATSPVAPATAPVSPVASIQKQTVDLTKSIPQSPPMVPEGEISLKKDQFYNLLDDYQAGHQMLLKDYELMKGQIKELDAENSDLRTKLAATETDQSNASSELAKTHEEALKKEKETHEKLAGDHKKLGEEFETEKSKHKKELDDLQKTHKALVDEHTQLTFDHSSLEERHKKISSVFRFFPNFELTLFFGLNSLVC